VHSIIPSNESVITTGCASKCYSGSAEASDNRLPNDFYKGSANILGPRYVNQQQRKEILDQLTCRAILAEHEEDAQEDNN
jgi:hypothetical protein